MEGPQDIYGSEQPPPLVRQPPSRAFPSAAATSDRFSHHSHRRRRRREEKGAKLQGLLWALAFLLVVGYAGYLVYNRKKAAVKVPPPPPPPVSAPAPPPELAGVPVAKPSTPAAGQDVKQLIVNWTTARRVLLDVVELQRGGRLDEAVKRLRSALEKNPSDLDLRAGLAEVLFQQREFEQAEKELLLVLAADPDRISARQMLALVYDNLHRHDQALVVLKWVLEKDPFAVDVHQMAGRVCLSLNLADEAVDHLRRVTGVQRDNVTAINMLAQAYTLQGKYSQAEAALKSVMELDAKNSSTYYNLAVCRARQNQMAGVVEVLNAAAGMFGAPFVLSWAGSPEFAAVRTNEAFLRWQTSVGSLPPPATPAPAAPAP